ncbi:L-threonylcarbamoyladenylate synthase [Texcoconibacillus texcoconensis]|uniref:Threonylcarbamoyl-AMP synthase n=1 Tax=Texcoconibacillus texcoconensis TaxID=1095777 RepID=A0A840QRY8_9BACI|nr:L-threonylcarbamoyladenylate synthase [Texcoconibacillus texcoconensis]MBB5174088.1 L-threonylcarbamoyladenylate synthase [Texcoconibacillus texcoconensis]
MSAQQSQLWIVDKGVDSRESYQQVERASLWIRQGEVVAFPTETVYGLGGDAFSSQAIEKIFAAKGRPSDNPLIVHIADEHQLTSLTNEVNDTARALIKAFWPGPLTLVLPNCGNVSPAVTAGLSTVAVRMPDHPVARAFLRACQTPVAAPSANRSGRPSPTTAQHVLDDLDGRIAGVVDGGPTGVGLESTVVDCSGAIPMILRPGGITAEAIRDVVGDVTFDPALSESSERPRSPGVKYTHYAPNARFVLVDGSPSFLQSYVNEARDEGLKVGVMTTEGNADQFDSDVVLTAGNRSDLQTVAREIYNTLRMFDEYEVDVIYGEVFAEQEIGQAVMNRLLKAAGGQKVIEPTE